MTNPMPITFTLSETAKALNISRPTMLQLARRSDFPAIKVGTRWIINVEGLQRWLDIQIENKELDCNSAS